MKEIPEATAGRTVSDEDAREALELLAVSSSFSGSDRLMGFLRYVVDEKLGGRGDLIRGKSIALDVYGYKPDEIEQRESVVRVDAGRIRRKLAEYYNGEGQNSLVRIELPKGGYIPVFQAVPSNVPNEALPLSRNRKRQRPFLLGFGLLGVVVIVSGVLFWQAERPRLGAEDTESIRRTVMFDTSPQRLQAVDLAEQGRDLMFPAFNPERLRASLLMFQSAKDLDETYEGGYAGASQVQGLMSLLIPDENRSKILLRQSVSQSEKALELSPTSAWAISAQAWSEFAFGNYDTAMLWSDKARQLEPLDPHVLEFHALILLYSGEFDRVIKETNQMLARTDGKAGFVFRNARAASYFHRKNYADSIEEFETAVAMGAPMGPVTVAYMMASNHYLGQTDRAKELVRRYETNWPNQRVDLIFMRLFDAPEFGEHLANGMYAAGWNPNELTAQEEPK